MRYMHYFESANTFDVAYNGDEYHEPWVSLTMQNRDVHYNKNKEIPLKEMPLTFEVLSPGELFFGHYSEGGSFSKTIEYSKNGGDWTSITSSLVTISEGEEPVIISGGTKIQVVSGDTIQFRGNNSAYSELENMGFSMFGSFNSRCKVKGNIMSLINSTDFTNLTTLESGGTFVSLFNLFVNLTDASELLLPATTLSDYCYESMFSNCTSLTTAPELPATALTEGCYENMFYSCGLTGAPALPATTLAEWCYDSMFSDCTGLTSVPVNYLPVTTLTESCYSYMFRGCTNLTQAPELPATTLANECYYYMFYGCSNLNYIKCLATDISATNCTSNWVNGVASTGTFECPSSTSWTTGNDGIPTNWTRVNA